MANGHHRNILTRSLQQDEGTIEDHEQLKSYITKYYKYLLGAAKEEKLLYMSPEQQYQPDFL
jgi:hypothetical protein